jgi:hypothetical protein
LYRLSFITMAKALYKKTKPQQPMKALLENGHAVLQLEWFEGGIGDAEFASEEWLYLPYSNQSSWAMTTLGLVPDPCSAHRRFARQEGCVALALQIDALPDESEDIFEAMGLSIFPQDFLMADLHRWCAYTVHLMAVDPRDSDDFDVSHILVRPYHRPGHLRKVFWKGSVLELEEASLKAARCRPVPAAVLDPPAAGQPALADEPLPIEDAIPDGDPAAAEDDESANWAHAMEATADMAVEEEARMAAPESDHVAPDQMVVDDDVGYVSDEVVYNPQWACLKNTFCLLGPRSKAEQVCMCAC